MSEKPFFRARIDRLCVEAYESREDMGARAGRDIARAIGEAVALRGEARVVFAAAPSQNETLATLRECRDVDWTKVTAYHMDEYVGLPEDAPQRFANYLDRELFERVPFKAVYRMSFSGAPLEPQLAAYASALGAEPVDIVCMGVGENGHIAFNDPGVADFSDPRAIKVVDLDETCRMQQVNDRCFETIDQVPRRAVTLTIPAILSGRRLFCVVPGATKAAAVRAMLTGGISEKCPASVLRRHACCTLYLDRDACGLLDLERFAPEESVREICEELR